MAHICYCKSACRSSITNSAPRFSVGIPLIIWAIARTRELPRRTPNKWMLTMGPMGCRAESG
jgi:hypothetical protein